MTGRGLAAALAAAAGLLLVVGVWAAPAVSPIEAVTNRAIRDYQGSATLADADLDALRKIGKDYADAYRAKTMDAYFKEPGRIRFEAHGYGLTFTQVVSTNTIYTSVAGISQKPQDIRTRPQRRQSSLELGFITPSALADFNVKNLGDAMLMGRNCRKLELHYKQADLAKRKILLWADIERKALVRRELYNDDGTMKVRFTYSTPKQVAPGIWVPTRITVHNGQNQFGGNTTYSNIRVNKGVSDDLFKHA